MDDVQLEVESAEYHLEYPSHLFEPEDYLSFLEPRAFLNAWKRCGLDDRDLAALQIAIMIDPKGHPVVKNTGGLRKIRFSPGGSSSGKSSAFRACYAYFEEYGIVLMLAVYPKSQKDNLSAAEKAKFKDYISLQKELLDQGPFT